MSPQFPEMCNIFPRAVVGVVGGVLTADQINNISLYCFSFLLLFNARDVIIDQTTDSQTKSCVSEEEKRFVLLNLC
jgi:hypothetical protein